jgi:hypothetical protein
LKEFYKNPHLTEEGVKYVKSLSEGERHLILIKMMDNHPYVKEDDPESVRIDKEWCCYMVNFKTDLLHLRKLNSQESVDNDGYSSGLVKYGADLEIKYLGELSEKSIQDKIKY